MRNQIYYLQKLHSEVLCIMDTVHKICIRNGIKYFLIEGSLLGAVRHNGFIPWDDDLDIAMPREDYERFLAIASKDLNDPYKLVTFKSDRNYRQPFAKVVNTRTLFQETPYSELGIFVDIFPLDINNGNLLFLKSIKSIYRILCNVPDKRKNLPLRFKYLPSHILSFLLDTHNALYLADKLVQKISFLGQGYFCNMASAYSINRETFPIEWFQNCVPHKFEDREYYVPNFPDGILIDVYGDNYMQEPPVNIRKTHYPLRVKFSDGEEIVFTKSKNSITYKDIEKFSSIKNK